MRPYCNSILYVRYEKTKTQMTLADYRQAPQSGISWMLILAFLSLTLFPYHYHLHHAVATAEQSVDNHNHSVDFHAHSDGSGFSDHDTGPSIEPVIDAPVKKSGVQLPWVAILLALLLILPLRAWQGRLHPDTDEPQSYRFSPYLIPPLRAPPRT